MTEHALAADMPDYPPPVADAGKKSYVGARMARIDLFGEDDVPPPPPEKQKIDEAAVDAAFEQAFKAKTTDAPPECPLSPPQCPLSPPERVVLAHEEPAAPPPKEPAVVSPQAKHVEEPVAPLAVEPQAPPAPVKHAEYITEPVASSPPSAKHAPSSPTVAPAAPAVEPQAPKGVSAMQALREFTGKLRYGPIKNPAGKVTLQFIAKEGYKSWYEFEVGEIERFSNAPIAKGPFAGCTVWSLGEPVIFGTEPKCEITLRHMSWVRLPGGDAEPETAKRLREIFKSDMVPALLVRGIPNVGDVFSMHAMEGIRTVFASVAPAVTARDECVGIPPLLRGTTAEVWVPIIPAFLYDILVKPRLDAEAKKKPAAKPPSPAAVREVEVGHVVPEIVDQKLRRIISQKKMERNFRREMAVDDDSDVDRRYSRLSEDMVGHLCVPRGTCIDHLGREQDDAFIADSDDDVDDNESDLSEPEEIVTLDKIEEAESKERKRALTKMREIYLEAKEKYDAQQKRRAKAEAAKALKVGSGVDYEAAKAVVAKTRGTIEATFKGDARSWGKLLLQKPILTIGTRWKPDSVQAAKAKAAPRPSDEEIASAVAKIAEARQAKWAAGAFDFKYEKPSKVIAAEKTAAEKNAAEKTAPAAAKKTGFDPTCKTSTTQNKSPSNSEMSKKNVVVVDDDEEEDAAADLFLGAGLYGDDAPAGEFSEGDAYRPPRKGKQHVDDDDIPEYDDGSDDDSDAYGDDDDDAPAKSKKAGSKRPAPAAKGKGGSSKPAAPSAKAPTAAEEAALRKEQEAVESALKDANAAEERLNKKRAAVMRAAEHLQAAEKERSQCEAELKVAEREAEAKRTAVDGMLKNIEAMKRRITDAAPKGVSTSRKSKMSPEILSAMQKCFDTKGVAVPSAAHRAALMTAVKNEIKSFMKDDDPVRKVSNARTSFETRRKGLLRKEKKDDDGKAIYSMMPGGNKIGAKDINGSQFEPFFRALAVFLTRYDDTEDPLVPLKEPMPAPSNTTYYIFVNWMTTYYSVDIPKKDPLSNFEGRMEDENMQDKLAEFLLKVAFFVIKSNDVIERHNAPADTKAESARPAKKAKDEDEEEEDDKDFC